MVAEVASYNRGVSEGLREKRTPSLGQLNPLIHKPNLYNSEMIQALKDVTLRTIDRYGGLIPNTIQAVYVSGKDNSGQRFIAQFETTTLTETQIGLLEKLAENIYDSYVKPTRTAGGYDYDALIYPPWDSRTSAKNKVRAFGWYLGPDTSELQPTHKGIYLFRDLGFMTRDNFLHPTIPNKGYLVEVREADLYQTDLVGLISQVSTILGKGEALDNSRVLYEVYYDLMRLGLKKMPGGKVFGLDDALKDIRRGLLRPLANLGLSLAIDEYPTSALMIGAPGTGKTFLAEYLLQQETGLIIAPIDVAEMSAELSAVSEKQTILPRISRFNYKTGIPIVIHIDDVEALAKNSSMLTGLMAGLRASGFYIIASTTEPEIIAQVSGALLQPQRFGILIHMGLPGVEARYNILSSHTPAESGQLKIRLFSSDEERGAVLRELARKTPQFTSRFLTEIANRAKELLIDRIAEIKGKQVGLTEEDLEGHPFTRADFLKALAMVSLEYNRDEVIKRDRELAEFVKHHKKVLDIVQQAKDKISHEQPEI